MQIDYLNICEPNQNLTNLHLYIIYVIFTKPFCPHVLYYLSMYNFCFKIIKFVTKFSQNFATIQTFAPKKEDDTYIDLFCHIELLLGGKSQISTLVIFNNSNRL